MPQCVSWLTGLLKIKLREHACMPRSQVYMYDKLRVRAALRSVWLNCLCLKLNYVNVNVNVLQGRLGCLAASKFAIFDCSPRAGESESESATSTNAPYFGIAFNKTQTQIFVIY